MNISLPTKVFSCSLMIASSCPSLIHMQLLICFISLFISLLYLEFYINVISMTFGFFPYLPSITIIVSRLFTVWRISICYSFLLLSNISMCEFYTVVYLSIINKHLGHFQVLSIKNKAYLKQKKEKKVSLMTSQRQFPCKRKATPQEQTSPLLLPPWSLCLTHTCFHTQSCLTL